ncbi:hypothetical protein H1C71_014076 [Ictidomys tridecemlineatus]|nr:hypothetical protein H1C71_014076 [Ictidomys tridecemlineatus]
MGPSTPVREIGDTVSDKSFQAPSKSNFRNRIKNFLQNIFCSNTKGQANSLPKIMTPSTPNQNQGSVTGLLLTDNRASETQALISNFGWIIEQKMRFHYEHSALKTNKVKEEYQASMGRQSHYSRSPIILEQRRVIGATSPGHQASPSDHSHLLNRWIRNKDNKQALLLKESVPLPSLYTQRTRVAGML